MQLNDTQDPCVFPDPMKKKYIEGFMISYDKYTLHLVNTERKSSKLIKFQEIIMNHVNEGLFSFLVNFS